MLLRPSHHLHSTKPLTDFNETDIGVNTGIFHNFNQHASDVEAMPSAPTLAPRIDVLMPTPRRTRRFGSLFSSLYCLNFRSKSIASAAFFHHFDD